MTQNQKDILFFAFRYAVVRNTYAHTVVIEELKNNWSEFESFEQIQIKTEIRQQNELTPMIKYIAMQWDEILTLDEKED